MMSDLDMVWILLGFAGGLLLGFLGFVAWLWYTE
jgi:hypothetical protein